MSIYLADTVTADQRAAIDKTLAGAAVVASRQYLSKADALARFKKTFTDLSGTLDGLGDNPLPASFEVKLQGGSETGVDLLLAELRQLPGVADVRYDREWLQRLSRAIGMVRGVGVVLGLLQVAVADLAVELGAFGLHAVEQR
jgi:cell division transport system permease protein